MPGRDIKPLILTYSVRVTCPACAESKSYDLGEYPNLDLGDTYKFLARIGFAVVCGKCVLRAVHAVNAEDKASEIEDDA